MFLKPNLQFGLYQKKKNTQTKIKMKWSIKRNARGKMVENHVHKMIDYWEGRQAVKLKRN